MLIRRSPLASCCVFLKEAVKKNLEAVGYEDFVRPIDPFRVEEVFDQCHDDEANDVGGLDGVEPSPDLPRVDSNRDDFDETLSALLDGVSHAGTRTQAEDHVRVQPEKGVHERVFPGKRE